MNPELDRTGKLSDYETLAGFDGNPGSFWSGLCEYGRGRFSADSVCLLLGGGVKGAKLRILAQSPSGAARRLANAGLSSQLDEVNTPELEPISGTLGHRFQAFVLTAREGSPVIWAVVEGPVLQDDDQAGVVCREMRSLAETYQTRRQARRSEERLLAVSEVLDLGLALGDAGQFEEAALRVCNELAAPMRASRVSLAWMEGQDIKLKATSHGGRISANSEEALTLEQVMEEAVDQDDEVSHPELPGATVISREHRQFSIAREGVAVVSVPLRHDLKAVGAICLERPGEEGLWESGEIEQIRLMADLVAPRLAGLHVRSGWFGRRAWRVVRRHAAGWLGYENTGRKLAVVLSLIALVLLAVIRVEHKVKAPFILKTDAAVLVSAPFPGYIDAAHYHVGDVVVSGQPLVEMDRKELLLEEADYEAERNQSEQDIRSAEGEGRLAEMRVAQAKVRQAEARLAIVRHRLELTRITAPFDGVVVEGDLRERLGSPVQKGDLLLKIVQLEDLFGQLQVDDRDISYLASGQEGELAFTSRPGEKFSVRLDRFEPVAETRPEGSVFLLRAHVLDAAQPWWRPGMSGICKIGVGERSLLWIGTHRIVEKLRLWFWI